MHLDNDCWWPEVFESLHGADNRDELFWRAHEAARQLGFSYCSYGVRVPLTVAGPTVTVLDSYPADWMAHYTEQNYMKIDPTVRLGARDSGLMVWSDDLFSSAPRLWSDAQARGLRVGVAQSSWAPGGVFGLLSMARENEVLTPHELKILRPRLRWLADTVHQKMQKMLAAEVVGHIALELSEREREVLTWTAEGKTSWEISRILDISESTVNFHVKNIIIKLNARNKLHAAATAVARGLLG